MAKPKTLIEWAAWCGRWDSASHSEKLEIAKSCDVTYDSARHWRSDCPIPTKNQEESTIKIEQSVPPEFEYNEPNVPLKVNTKKGYVSWLIMGDTHFPYHNKKALELVELFMREQQPDAIVYNGDLTDFYQVSVFSKDPARMGQLQDDMDMTTQMFDRHSVFCPEAEKWFIMGTHEHRWMKYLQDKAAPTARLRSNRIENQYQLDDYGINYVGYERGLLVNDTFLILHGDIAAAHSSYTAKRHFEKKGGSGMCNHTHRLGSYYKTNRFGIYGWWENGCLCTLTPDWLQHPDWQPGFSMVHFNDDGRFWAEQIPIVKDKFMFGGKLYG